MSLKNNQDVACFYVVKHSWKGKFRRIFSVGTLGISTYNPNTMEATNQWLFEDFMGIKPAVKSTVINEFHICVRRGRKADTMRFSSEHRSDIITTVLHNHHRFSKGSTEQTLFFPAAKLHWSGQSVRIRLGINSCCLMQLSVADASSPLSVYNFSDIEMMAPLSDVSDGFVLVTAAFGRRHAFTSTARDSILRAVSDRALCCVGEQVAISRDALPLRHFWQYRLGIYGVDDGHVTSISEFSVYKLSSRSAGTGGRVARTLCLTESCVIERDPATYTICTLQPFTSLHALVRCTDSQQMLAIEYCDGRVRRYISTDRDSLLASLMDSCRAAGNIGVHVRCSYLERGWRWSPLSCSVEEEVESLHLRFLQQPPASWTFDEAVSRFNCNVSYSGLVHAVSGDSLFAENKEKLISGAIMALLQRDIESAATNVVVLEAQFHALRRLIASKAGFAAFTQMPGMREQLGLKVVRSLKRDSVCVTHAAIDMLAALMQPMHADSDLKQEQLNKTSILSSRTFLQRLLEVFVDHVGRSSALVVASFLDFLSYGISAPYSETTDGAQFDCLLEMLCSHGRSLYQLFGHSSLAIVKGAGLLLRAVIEEGSGDMPAKMQQLALSEGAVLTHLRSALFCESTTGRFLANRQLSRQLLQLWTVDNNAASELLQRVLPAGLMMFLDSEEVPPASVIAADGNHLYDRNNLSMAQQNMSPTNSSAMSQHMKYLNQQVRNVEKFVERHVETALLHWRAQMKPVKTAEQLAREKPVVLRKRREAVRSDKNWPLLFYQFDRDHSQPHLLWNSRTREELKETLDGERRRFVADCELSGQLDIAWNHREFEVPYRCLQNEVQVGDYYLRVLLEQDEANQLSNAPMHNPSEFFAELYHRFLLSSSTDMKCMCLQALAIVYARHHEEIGAFSDCRYIVVMLEKCNSFLERDRLVVFINKLAFNRKNVKLLIDADLVTCFCDLLTLAHTHTDKPHLPSQRNVLEQGDGDGGSGDGTSSEREWYYKDDKDNRHGPLSLSELRELWQSSRAGSNGDVNGVCATHRLTSETRCWAQGIEGGWSTLGKISQLRWTLLVSGRPLLNATDLAVLVLNTLIQMCRFYPSRDASTLSYLNSDNGSTDSADTSSSVDIKTSGDGGGSVIRPMPRLQRQLSSSSCLPHIVQLLLTFDPIIVEKVAVLLTEIMRDNPAISRLYLSGVYFFILMYTGSNVLPVARFLEMTHMCQADRLEDAVSADICERSVLSHLLPEAMICYLHYHGADKFAQIFLGEFDTPEVIWGSEMRKMLIMKISSHLADYTPRLRANTRALYQYCPIPAVSFEQLENEVFCGRYYLRHLCDLSRFPDWPISEPVALLKEVLLAWRREVDKKPASMSVREALLELGLTEGCGDTDQSLIRKAYFRLAQQHHPDKNPTGREKFEAVNRAYDFLCSRSARAVEGPDAANIVLILRAQSILFSRYSDTLRPYKYAGYPMLVKTISMETADAQLFSKPSPLLPAATELAFYTLRCSPLNVEELRREGGLQLLQEAFTRCCSVLSKMSSMDDLAVQVCCHVCRCFGVAAHFSQCRDRLIEMRQIVDDLCRIVYYKRLTRLCTHGVDCVSAFAVDSILQMYLLQAGVLWPLVQFLFYYDYTLEEGGVERTDHCNQQEMVNSLAKKSLIALTRLAGYLDGDDATPPNAAIDASLTAMLTPRMAVMLKKREFHEVLKLLNVNTENPYIIWNDRMQSELRAFLKEQQTLHIRTGNSDAHFGGDFTFSHTASELVIDGVYVRVYNDNPLFVLDSPKQFVVELLNFIALAFSSGELKSQGGNLPDHMEHVPMSLLALTNVIVNNAGVELLFIGRFEVLSSCLSESSAAIQRQCVLLLRPLSASRPCVDDIAAGNSTSSSGGATIPHLLINLVLAVATDISDMLSEGLLIVHALLANTGVVRQCLETGIVVFLLHLFCSGSEGSGDVRRQSVELLARMLADRLVGPRVRLLLLRWLPMLFVDLLREAASNTTQMFDSSHENPELLWTDDSRCAVRDTVAELARAFIQSQRTCRSAVWDIPSCSRTLVQNTSGELMVDGVYVRLLVDNPGWVLRHPHDFFNKAIDQLLNIIESTSPDDRQQTDVELLASAVVHVLRVQPAVLSALPAQGHIGRVIAALAVTRPYQLIALLRVMAPLTSSDVCVRALAHSDAVRQLTVALKTQCSGSDAGGAGVAEACHVINRLFAHSDGCASETSHMMVQQALSAGLVPLLLNLLDSRLVLSASGGAATVKAHIVNTLKTMAACAGGTGDQVTALLSRSSVWPEYRDQKHDLFLGRDRELGALTAAAPVTAGYLTAAELSPTSNNLPPL